MYGVFVFWVWSFLFSVTGGVFAVAVFQVVVYEAGGLEEGVACGGAEELDAALFHVFAHGV